MEQPKTPPRRSVVIAARLIAAILSLAAAEAMLWFLGYPIWWAMDPAWGGASPEYQCDSDLGWKAREGTFDLRWSGDPPQRYTNWSGGRRATSPHAPANDAGTRPQVMFFGDSYTQGYHLADAATLPWLVQARHPELNVSNFGAGNYGTYQAYLAMKKWVRGPTSVYYNFSAFHEERNAAAPSWLRIARHPPAGCFYPYVELSGEDLQQHKSFGDVIWPLSRRLRLVAMVEEYKEIIESYRRVQNKRRVTEALLVKMNQLALAEGGKFTVILFDMTPQERNDYRNFLESHGIQFVNCDHPQMTDRSLRLMDGHPGPGLNQLVAGWIEPLQVVEPAPRVSAESHPSQTPPIPHVTM